MKKQIFLFTVLIVLYLIAFISCREEESNGPWESDIEYYLPQTFQSTDIIRYNIEGGGNIDFLIEDNTSSFSVSILEYQFQPTNEFIVISKEEVDSLDKEILDLMFKGTIDIGGFIYRNDLPTGSWTYLYIDSDGDWLRVANTDIISELSSFYQLVDEKLDM